MFCSKTRDKIRQYNNFMKCCVSGCVLFLSCCCCFFLFCSFFTIFLSFAERRLVVRLYSVECGVHTRNKWSAFAANKHQLLHKNSFKLAFHSVSIVIACLRQASRTHRFQSWINFIKKNFWAASYASNRKVLLPSGCRVFCSLSTFDRPILIRTIKTFSNTVSWSGTWYWFWPIDDREDVRWTFDLTYCVSVIGFSKKFSPLIFVAFAKA